MFIAKAEDTTDTIGVNGGPPMNQLLQGVHQARSQFKFARGAQPIYI